MAFSHFRRIPTAAYAKSSLSVHPLSEDLTVISRIPAVPSILDVICSTTGMGFAAVARVTEDRWVACSVLDKIEFGLKPGGELKLESTICHEIRQTRVPVVIDHVAKDPVYCKHHTPAQYGFQSYISMPIILPDGRFFGTLCAIDPRPARLETPEVIGMFRLFADLIAFHIDATEKLSRSESTLLAEREMSELREQFIGVLGHDLRNPLGALSAGVTLLRQGSLDPEQAETVAMMSRSVSRMSDLIDDAVDFTRGRLGGGITLETRSDIPLEPVLTQVLDEARAIWPSRQIEAHFDLAGRVRYDRKRIAQLFTNLLSNAMTYGRKEEPVKVTAVAAQGKFELSVSNSADPIPPEILGRLFEPFQRGDSTNYQQGLGLGLYIASEIARSHGGTLGVISDAEETRFTFAMESLALEAAETTSALSAQPETPAAGPAGNASGGSAQTRILLIEDHADTLAILTRLLTRKGHTVIPVPTGAAARSEFASNTFDLIVSDLSLSDCSGLDLMAEFSATRRLPAIAMSGYGMESDIANCKAAGFTEHLTKPIDFDQFLRTVDRVTANRNS
jgi:signal transduction histidine kinase